VSGPRDQTLLVTGLAGAAFLAVYLVLSIVIGEGFAIPIGLFGAVGGAIALRGPVGKALAARIEGGPQGGMAPPDEVLAELDELRHRMVELEERQDFTERLLTRARDGADAPPQGGAGHGGF